MKLQNFKLRFFNAILFILFYGTSFKVKYDPLQTFMPESRFKPRTLCPVNSALTTRQNSWITPRDSLPLVTSWMTNLTLRLSPTINLSSISSNQSALKNSCFQFVSFTLFLKTLSDDYSPNISVFFQYITVKNLYHPPIKKKYIFFVF